MTTYVDPPWDAPFDTEAYLKAVPSTALIKGLFGATVTATAKQRRIVLASAAEKYLPFLDYPLAHHNRLLIEAAHAFWPEVSLRHGLRRIGRAAVASLLETTFGKALLGGLTQPDTVLLALSSLARAYTTTLSKPTPAVEVISTGERSAVMRMRDAWVFLDCQQVGILEGLVRTCGARATVRVAVNGLADGELHCEWEPDERAPTLSMVPGSRRDV